VSTVIVIEQEFYSKRSSANCHSW